MILVATISIFIISGGILLAKKIWPTFKVCPNCAGVSGTWIWILIGIWSSWLEAESWKLVAALAMGGSVVGIVYQLEHKVRVSKTLAWKILFIPFGFLLAYNLIYFSWLYVALLLVAILFILFFFLKWPVTKKDNASENNNVEGIEKKMKDCC